MTQQHTPGPWRWTEPNPKADAKATSRLVGAESLLTGATIETNVNGWGAYQDETREANARLIAAAPDMLAALKEGAAFAQQVLDFWEADRDLATAVSGLHNWLLEIGPAIKQAEGGE